MRRIFRWAGVGLLTVVALVAAGTYFYRLPFDAALWRQGVRTSDFITYRSRMAHSLLNRPLTGMTRAEVHDLLGQPTFSQRFEVLKDVYLLGPDSLIGFENEYIGIWYDENVVTKARWYID